MTVAAWVAGGCLVFAAVLGGIRPRQDRLRALRLSPAGVPRRVPRAGLPPWWAAGLGGLAVTLLVGGWSGLLAGALCAVLIDRAVRRLEPRAVRAERAAAAAGLPYAVDLLGAVLRAGSPLDQALVTVGAAVRGPLGGRLDRVGRMLRLGMSPVDAWQHLADLSEAAPLVAAAVRANESGAALAGACTRAVARMRQARGAAADAAAHRAAVLVVLPLGACFLPAFVLVGVVPIVIGVLDDVLV